MAGEREDLYEHNKGTNVAGSDRAALAKINKIKVRVAFLGSRACCAMAS